MTQAILFVDEEKIVLNALKRSFRKMRQQWDMRFATGPSEALEILENEPIEVIVSETVFQGQSGLDFFEMVREEHPHNVRIIHIANAMAECGEDIHQPQGIVDGLDYEYLERAGLLASLTQWKAACADYATDTGKTSLG